MQQPECPRCRKAGLIRTERIFKAGAGTTAFYCGNCGHSWEERDEPPAPPPAGPAQPAKPRDTRRPGNGPEKGRAAWTWP